MMTMPERRIYLDCLPELMDMAEQSEHALKEAATWRWVRENPARALDRITALEQRVKHLEAERHGVCR